MKFTLKNGTLDEQYKEKLKKETVQKCDEFSFLFFEVYCNDNIIEAREAIKNGVNQIKALEQGNEPELLNYLEHLVLHKGHREYIIPYYSISNDINKPIPDAISVYESMYFALLGQVKEILSLKSE